MTRGDGNPSPAQKALGGVKGLCGGLYWDREVRIT